MRKESLLEASYKGFKLLVLNESESGGRTLVVHEYPNSDRVEIQDMGGIPQTFSVNAVVHGENFLARSERFRDLLIDGEEGELVLQNFGYINARVRTYTREASQSGIGGINFRITFEIEKMKSGEDFAEIVTEQDLYEEYYEAQKAIQEALENNWKEPSTKDNFLASADDGNSFVNAVKSVAQGVKDAVRAADKIKSEIETYIMKANMFAELWVDEGPLAAMASAVGFGREYTRTKEMVAFGSKMKKKFGTGIRKAQDSAENLVSGDVSQMDFSIPLWEEYSTKQWDERNNNRLNMVESVRGQALNYMLLNGPGHTGNTLESINAVKNDLQNAYDELVYGDRDKVIFDDQGYVRQMKVLKDTSFRYLQQKEEKVFRQKVIDVGVTTAEILAYELYAEKIKSREDLEEFAEILSDMNEKRAYLMMNKVNVLERD